MNPPALCVSALVLIGSLGVSAAPQDDVVYDDEVTLVSFEGHTYPSIAEFARVSGDVVVSVTLNDDGSVKDAVALSGPRLLVPDAVANARKWKFMPNRQRRAVIVYEFRIDGNCLPDGRSLFLLFRPNVVSVSTCVPPVEAGLVFSHKEP